MGLAPFSLQLAREGRSLAVPRGSLAALRELFPSLCVAMTEARSRFLPCVSFRSRDCCGVSALLGLIAWRDLSHCSVYKNLLPRSGFLFIVTAIALPRMHFCVRLTCVLEAQISQMFSVMSSTTVVDSTSFFFRVTVSFCTHYLCFSRKF